MLSHHHHQQSQILKTMKLLVLSHHHQQQSQIFKTMKLPVLRHQHQQSQIFKSSSERRATMMFLREKMVNVTPKSANLMVLFISFCINKNIKIRISITVQSALCILGKPSKGEWKNIGCKERRKIQLRKETSST